MDNIKLTKGAEVQLRCGLWGVVEDVYPRVAYVRLKNDDLIMYRPDGDGLQFSVCKDPSIYDFTNGEMDVVQVVKTDPVPELVDALRKMKRCTNVLGAGIGKISIPDGFFAEWNEAELKASELIERLKQD
jgi:hypothetical protein